MLNFWDIRKKIILLCWVRIGHKIITTFGNHLNDFARNQQSFLFIAFEKGSQEVLFAFNSSAFELMMMMIYLFHSLLMVSPRLIVHSCGNRFQKIIFFNRIPLSHSFDMIIENRDYIVNTEKSTTSSSSS